MIQKQLLIIEKYANIKIVVFECMFDMVCYILYIHLRLLFFSAERELDGG